MSVFENAENVLNVDNLSIAYETRGGDVKAVRKSLSW